MDTNEIMLMVSTLLSALTLGVLFSLNLGIIHRLKEQSSNQIVGDLSTIMLNPGEKIPNCLLDRINNKPIELYSFNATRKLIVFVDFSVELDRKIIVDLYEKYGSFDAIDLFILCLNEINFVRDNYVELADIPSLFFLVDRDTAKQFKIIGTPTYYIFNEYHLIVRSGAANTLMGLADQLNLRVLQ